MAGAAPGGTRAGRYVTVVSCQVSGRRAGRFRAAESRRRALAPAGVRNETRAQGHLPRPRCGGVPLAEGFPRHATGLPIGSLQCLPVRPDLLVQPVRRVAREHLAGAADRAPQAVLQDAEAVVAAVSPRPLQLSQGGILIHLEHAARLAPGSRLPVVADLRHSSDRTNTAGSGQGICSVLLHNFLVYSWSRAPAMISLASAP